jgi:hypothetical protein
MRVGLFVRLPLFGPELAELESDAVPPEEGQSGHCPDLGGPGRTRGIFGRGRLCGGLSRIKKPRTRIRGNLPGLLRSLGGPVMGKGRPITALA